MKTSDLLLIGLLATTGLAEDRFTAVAGKQHLSEQLSVFKVNKEDRYTVDGQGHFVGAGFQPSALLDRNGTLHVFFQARLDGSGDKSAKMIAHTASKDGGRSFSKIKFVNPLPMQTYAMSSFTRTLPSGAERISVMASLSIDETVGRLKHPALIKERLGIDVSSFSRKAACLILEYYSDDGGASWTRKEHHGVTDRVYKRNDRDYYLAFINLIGQAREIEKGPYAGRLILAGPLRGDYLPCPDHPKFRNYKPSSSLIYSDNNGESWQFGGVIDDETAFQHNEASAVPVNGGKQILMARRCNTQADGKTMHHSDDGGATWNPGFTTSVAATRCLQVLETSGDTVLCSAPGSKKRTNGRIYISRDHGLNWTYKQIDKGPFSYSTVNRLTDGYFICCYSLGATTEKRESRRGSSRPSGLMTHPQVGNAQATRW